MPEPVGDALPSGEEVGVEARGAERGQHAELVGEDHHQHQPEPVAGQGEQRHRDDRERRVEPSAPHRLEHADGDAEQIAEHQRDADQPHRRGPRLGERARHRPPGGDAGAPVAPDEPAEPGGVLLRAAGGRGRGRVRCAATCSSVAAGPTSRRAGSPGASRSRKNISVSTPKTTAAPLSARRRSRRTIAGISRLPNRAASEIASGVPRRLLPALLVACVLLPACQPEAEPPRRHGALRLRRGPPEHQSAAHPAPAGPPGAALRAAHDAGALRQRARAPAVSRARVELERGSPPAHLPAAAAAYAGTTACPRPRATSPGRSSGARDPATGYPRLTDLAALEHGGRAGRLHRRAALRAPAGAIPRRAHRPRDPAGAPARHGAGRPAAAGGVERPAGGQRPLPVRGPRAEPALGLRRRHRDSPPRWAGRRGSTG